MAGGSAERTCGIRGELRTSQTTRARITPLPREQTFAGVGRAASGELGVLLEGLRKAKRSQVHLMAVVVSTAHVVVAESQYLHSQAASKRGRDLAEEGKHRRHRPHCSGRRPTA